MRLAHSELCFDYQEFAALNHVEICRRLNIGDSWLDEERDAAATREVTSGTAHKV